MIWIIGEYAERIDNADELLEGFLDGFKDENSQVQLQLLTAIVKLFLKKPTETPQDLVTRVLTLVTQVCWILSSRKKFLEATFLFRKRIIRICVTVVTSIGVFYPPIRKRRKKWFSRRNRWFPKKPISWNRRFSTSSSAILARWLPCITNHRMHSLKVDMHWRRIFHFARELMTLVATMMRPVGRIWSLRTIPLNRNKWCSVAMWAHWSTISTSWDRCPVPRIPRQVFQVKHRHVRPRLYPICSTTNSPRFLALIRTSAVLKRHNLKFRSAITTRRPRHFPLANRRRAAIFWMICSVIWI